MHAHELCIAIAAAFALVGPCACDAGVEAASRSTPGSGELASASPPERPREPSANDGDALKASPPAPDSPPVPGTALPQLASLGAERLERGPQLVVIAALDDPALREPLQDLDAIGQLYADDGLGTFALLGERGNPSLRAVGDPAGTRGRVDALRKRWRLAMPLLLAGPDRATLEALRMSEYPTVVLLDAGGTVVWSGAALERWPALDDAIVRTLGSR